ncbi:MAG: hypothetical protein EON92_11670 [Burkholderiales bacterium]|nr:MAG: hypothetical protein EON92_11670 [Burkholderiales bacterium]
MMPAGKRFRPSWRGLEPGDPWTFITAHPFRQGVAGPLAEAGSIIEWLADDGPALLFHIDEIMIVDLPRNLRAYSCTHISQPPAFREARAL